MFKKKPQPQPDDPHLGPFLFERRCPMTPLMALGAVLTCVGGIIVLIELGSLLAGAGSLGTPMVAAAAVGLSAGLWMVVASWKEQATLRFCQRGVLRATKRGEERLPYEQIAGITYKAVRMHHNGMYTGTNLTMMMKPAPELGFKPFKYSGKFKEKKKGFFNATYESTDELEPIHTAISERLAGEMIGRLAAGEAVPWTKTLTLRTDGIAINGQLLPWERLKSASLEGGQLVIKAEGKWLAAATAGSGEENFLAGWIALNHLIRSLERTEPPGVSAG